MSKEELEFKKKFMPLYTKYKEYEKKLVNTYTDVQKKVQIAEEGTYRPKEQISEKGISEYASKHKEFRPLYKKYKKYQSIVMNYLDLLAGFMNDFQAKYGVDAYNFYLKKYKKQVH